ncbi:hypothetical protein NQ317_012506 [Molorchus minor]|uniref:Uncharacterized protein n=1 Tax=Molorchus minor TaxID=1323400 RepID=A0ABQ9K4E0_9CUCU|nr:hypothetical protein NQ317_012506 [Molorchus minor]
MSGNITAPYSRRRHNFNVADFKSKHNYFTNYSVQGKENPRSYMYQIRNGNNLYSFIAVDACLEPGPRRPFNFVGMLDTLEIETLNSLISKSGGKRRQLHCMVWPFSDVVYFDARKRKCEGSDWEE